MALLTSWKQVPLPLIVFCLGVIPGLCEELFFRGFCYNGLRSRLSPPLTILLTALIFAAFHLLLSGGASPERFIPSFLMGLLLGFVRAQTQSIWPSTFLHILHNSTLLTLAYSSKQFENWLGPTTSQTHIPTTWLVGSLSSLIICLFIFYQLGKSRTEAINTQPTL